MITEFIIVIIFTFMLGYGVVCIITKGYEEIEEQLHENIKEFNKNKN